MKGKKYLAAVLALVLVLLTASTVSAKTERIDFTFRQWCDWDNVDWGREIFNGQANYIEKHFKQTCYMDYASIPEVSGAIAIDINLNIVGHDYLNGQGAWKFTGKGYWVTDEGGVWETNCVYPWPMDLAHCEGRGEGKYAGYQIFFQTGGQDMMGYGYITFNSP